MVSKEADRCPVCNKPLSYCKTIFAAFGSLYCSERCGKRVVEGFDLYAEELTPSSIGIVPYATHKVTGVTKFGKRIKPIYTRFPTYFAREVFIGSVWRVRPDGKLEKEYTIFNGNRR